MSFFEALFELLFKYPPSIFSAGRLAFSPSWVLLAAGILLLLAGLTMMVRIRRQGLGARFSALLVGLRAAALLLVVLCLARPTLLLSTVVPQASFVGVLLDDSQSMLIEDEEGETRAAKLGELLAGGGDGLLADLRERFEVRLFAFSRGVRRIKSEEELEYGGTASHLSASLVGLLDELQGVPLAGLVLLSDGADNAGDARGHLAGLASDRAAGGTLDEALVELRSRGTPVYVVGLGSESYERDIQVSRVEAPPAVIRGSTVGVEVTLEQTGFSGSAVTLEVEDGGRLVSTRPVSFPMSGEAVVARVDFVATEAGPRSFRFRVPPRAGEVVTRNNRRTALIHVEDRVEKILYFEGEPRFELKFLRRAVQDDQNLQLVVLQRTAENRFSRFGLDDKSELQGGFPTTREELFRYSGLVLGSIEASFFTLEQLRMIGDFASGRGGGFLMIGGRRAFSEGGWAGTPVADLLPVELGPAASGEGDDFFSELEISLTSWGRSHPALRLAESEEASAEIWKRLPAVSTFNPVTRLKPGATSLLVGRGEGIPGEQIVLAHQRHGRGRSLAFTVHDSWHWQMHADVPVEDLSHERLWRQLLRWLVSYVPRPVQLRPLRERVGAGEEVELVAEISDESFLAVNSARALARVETPAGETLSVPLDWSVEKDGEYRGRFPASEEGLYRISLDATSAGRSLGGAETWLEAAPMDNEFFAAQRRPAVLERIAEGTGGRVVSQDSAGRIAEELATRGEGVTRIERRDLWDMPALFLLVVMLLGAEWGVRRRIGIS